MANISGYVQGAGSVATSIKANATASDEIFTIIGTNSTSANSTLSKLSNLTVNASTGQIDSSSLKVGELTIESNGTLGSKIVNTQNGSSSNPAATGRTDFYNDDTTGSQVNSTMIDYSGIHTTTLNSLPNQASSILNICPNSARSAAVNIANGSNNTSGCIVNIANGTGTNASLVRIGKNNLIELDSNAQTLNLSNSSSTGTINVCGGQSATGTINIGSGNGSTGAINAGGVGFQ